MASTRLLPDEPVASLDDWLAGDGGLGLAAALDLSGADVFDRLDQAGLRGRGGAGFPTGRKWRSVVDAAASTASPVYLVANGAEGEPGTYKDRTIIAQNPYLFLEGVLIALHATGGANAYVAIKAKFGHEVARLRTALEEFVAAGWRGADRVTIVEGPDDYLFGEESAMLEVVAGRDALPRMVKPFEIGLFASENAEHPNPTIVNNVETLSHVTQILANGPQWFREAGTDESPGTMLFTVVGDVESPGVYELPLGVTLRELVVDIAGAVDPPKAIFSGVSNPVMTAEHLDVPLGFDSMRDAGGGLGSGGFVVYDRDRSMVRATRTLSRFLALESCGQCNACKLGTGAITETLDALIDGSAGANAVESLLDRSRIVTDQSRCALPAGEQAIVLSVVARFSDEFEAALDGPVPDAERPYPVPLIDHLDDDTGEVVYAWRFDAE